MIPIASRAVAAFAVLRGDGSVLAYLGPEAEPLPVGHWTSEQSGDTWLVNAIIDAPAASHRHWSARLRWHPTSRDPETAKPTDERITILYAAPCADPGAAPGA